MGNTRMPKKLIGLSSTLSPVVFYVEPLDFFSLSLSLLDIVEPLKKIP